MDSIIEQNQCTGCGCCVASCPTNAITMHVNETGFSYPSIHQEKCVNCGLCKKKCPIGEQQQKKGQDVAENRIFAVKHKEDHVRMNSASGGIFTALSDVILKEGGVIYGAVYNAEGMVEHRRADSFVERDRMRGSKYAQSNLIQVYSQIRQDLKEHKKVLFSGTPCQIVALYSFLGKDVSNLITCDIVCHGVMSPQILGEFQKLIARKKGNFSYINFRNKQFGWKSQQWTLHYKDGTSENSGLIKSFKRLYTRNLAIRESCFQCPFASKQRYADITIGDFWGISKVNSQFEDSMGISMIWIHTEKGMSLFEKCKENVLWISATEQSAEQPQLLKPTTKPKEYDSFWQYYQNKNIEKTLRRYGNAQVVKNSLLKLRKLIRKKV